MVGSNVARIEFDIGTDAPPEAIRAALLDFSDRRPELWPGLPRDQYEVYEVGGHVAEIREGYRGPIWVRERYTWPLPGRIEFTAVDSGFATAGSHVVVDIKPGDGGGSRVHVTWERWGKNLFGAVFIGLMVLTRGFFIRRSIKAGLDRVAGIRT